MIFPRTLPILLLAAVLAACPPPPEERAEREPERRPATQGTAPGDGFRDVVEAALPSIVFIQAEATPPAELERFIPNLPDEPMPFGMGSGVIFRNDGYILTNNHVVQDAERVMVVLHDRRYFEAEVIGLDPSTEVAVVRIRDNDLPVARMGDSDQIALGDWVLAMGSPLGLEFSVTAGIVSGMGRAIGIIGQQLQPGQGTPPLEHFIQIDAALSPGNSGGALMNTAGEVVGINTAVAVQPGMPTGFGFAIPSNLALSIAEQLIDHGEVRRPYLGVGLMTVTPALAEEQGLRTVEGAAVAHVEPGSPAADAGIREGDVILGIGDARIVTVSDLQAHLIRLQPGASVTLQVFRDGRETNVQVDLDEVVSRNARR